MSYQPYSQVVDQQGKNCLGKQGQNCNFIEVNRVPANDKGTA